MVYLRFGKRLIRLPLSQENETSEEQLQGLALCIKSNKMQDDILIFRTSITKKQDMERIETLFAQYPQIHKWNVDFDDWEKVLRIESRGITSTDVSDALQAICIYATELE